MDFEAYLYDRVLPVIQSWNEKDIYAISFFVYCNEAYCYNEISNVSEFCISYCTEEGCGHASPFSEERWNLPLCRQDETYIINPEDGDAGMQALFAWYKELGLDNIGYENCEEMYDENMTYIGKGPVGYYELLCAVSNVARRLQLEGKIKEKFWPIPIIVHALEFYDLIGEVTARANPGGEAAPFLQFLQESEEAAARAWEEYVQERDKSSDNCV